MTDVVLVQNGRAHEIFRGGRIKGMRGKFHRELVERMVEVESESVRVGDLFDPMKKVFSREPERPVSAFISYAQFRSRWDYAELMALHAAKQKDWRVEDFINLVVACNGVDLASDAAAQARQLFVKSEILSPARAAAVFARD